MSVCSFSPLTRIRLPQRNWITVVIQTLALTFQSPDEDSLTPKGYCAGTGETPAKGFSPLTRIRLPQSAKKLPVTAGDSLAVVSVP